MRWWLVVAFALFLSLAPAVAEVLVLDHAELERRVSSKVRGATISYAGGRVVLRARVRYCYVWFPIRIEADFERVDDHVRLVPRDLWVSGRASPSRLDQARERLEPLVNGAASVSRVDIQRDGKCVYSQVLDPDDGDRR